MIVPDANLLIYAYDDTAPQHAKARVWWEDTLSGSEPIGIPWIVVLAFVRLMTHSALSNNPMTTKEAEAAVKAWLSIDIVRLLFPSYATLDRWFAFLHDANTAGNLSTVAMIAALAVEHGGQVYSNDRDFGAFSNVPWLNPLS
jgi:toxin-antitoxin system PIN domain toxin